MKSAAVSALYLLMSIAFCWPLFANPYGLGGNDWDQHFFYYGSVLKNVIEYGQPPFWSPWYCGGNVMWQNPQIALLSPVYPLTALMPLQLAMKLNIVLHYWIGFVGMHLLVGRAIGVNSLAVVVFLSTVVTAAGAPAIHLAAGHSNFLPSFYLPLIAFLVFRAVERGMVRDALLAGTGLALMAWNGSPHIVQMACAALGTFASAVAAFRRDWRPLAVAAIFVVAGASFAAPKLLPVSLFVTGDRFWDTRIPTEHPDRVTIEMLRHVYLDFDRDERSTFDEQRHGWHEYGNYIGPFPAIVLVASILWVPFAGDRRHRALGRATSFTAVFLFAVSLGELGAYSPAQILAHIPLFSSFRIPSRYTIPFVLFGTIAAALAAKDALATPLLSRRSARSLVAILCVLASAHLIHVNRQLFIQVFDQEAAFDTTFHWMRAPNAIATDADSNPYTGGSPMFRALMEDRAFYNCYESLQLTRTSNAADRQIFADEHSEIVTRTFTPNQFEFGVLGSASGSRISLNQNWSPGWTSTAGPFLEPGKRMPAVMLAPGQTGTFAFEFFPEGLVMGFVIFAIAVTASAPLWRRSLPGTTGDSR